MPIFQKKVSNPESYKNVPTTIVPHPDGPRRSLTKALVEVVNSRKGDAPPKRNNKPSPPKSKGAESSAQSASEDTYDSTTAVESPAGVTTRGSAARATATMKTTIFADSTGSPMKRTSAHNPRATPSPTLSGSSAPRRRKAATIQQRISPTGPPSKLVFGSIRGLPKPSTSPALERKSVDSQASSSESRKTASPATSNRESPSPTAVVRKIAKPQPSPLNSVLVGAPASKLNDPVAPTAGLGAKTKQISGLPQPKTRPRSAIFIGNAPPMFSAPKPSTQTSPSNRKEDQELLSEMKVKAVKSGPSNEASAPNSKAPLIVEHLQTSSETKRDESNTPSPLPHLESLPSMSRALSPLPRRGQRPSGLRPPSRGESDRDSKESRVDTSHGGASRLAVPRASTSALPRLNASARHSIGGAARSLNIRGAAARAQAEGDISDTSNDSRPLASKRRRSETAPQSSHGLRGGQVNSGPSLRLRANRLTHTSSRNNNSILSSSSSNPPVPSTPAGSKSSNASTSKQPDQTFSIPRNRMISFTFADMTLPDTAEDEDNAAADNSFCFMLPPRNANAEDGISSGQSPAPLPTIFLPPSSSNTIPTLSPSPGRKRRNSSHRTIPAGRPIIRHSLLPFDAILERSREYSPDGDDLEAMLSEIPAPFDEDVRVPTSMSLSQISESSSAAAVSLLLDESEIGLPGTSASSQYGGTSATQENVNGDGDDDDEQAISPGSSSSQKITVSLSHSLNRSLSASTQTQKPPSLLLSPSPSSARQRQYQYQQQQQRQLTSKHLEAKAELECELEDVQVLLDERTVELQEHAARITSLESDLATIYSVTRARDSQNKSAMQDLFNQVAKQGVCMAQRDWAVVLDVVQAEKDTLIGDRLALETFSSMLDLLISPTT